MLGNIISHTELLILGKTLTKEIWCLIGSENIACKKTKAKDACENILAFHFVLKQVKYIKEQRSFFLLPS